ncbi:hypothetical protein CYMTET_47539 [Cymbomonas tetramitiformis]|uniref:Uncharacterized protein n=1 Tax=Cymbomonas tetramitiformis TaxID=36881 RepID=A0AAE0BU28_9CHLO|nr:hypothetical protein CYMTET_47539 [Cymbomonas tetramitiformis]
MFATEKDIHTVQKKKQVSPEYLASPTQQARTEVIPELYPEAKKLWPAAKLQPPTLKSSSELDREWNPNSKHTETLSSGQVPALPPKPAEYPQVGGLLKQVVVKQPLWQQKSTVKWEHISPTPELTGKTMAGNSAWNDTQNKCCFSVKPALGHTDYKTGGNWLP